MSTLANWLEQERAAQEALVRLIPSLLRNQLLPYSWYRLRYFALRTIVLLSIHVIEFFFFQFMFSGASLAAIATIQAFVSLLTVVSWSALEVMRTEVREKRRATGLYAVPKVLSPWLSFGVLLSVIGVFLCGVVLVLGLALSSAEHHLLVVTASVVLLRAALQFFPMVYHSGAYAVRRVYKPVIAIVGVDLARFGGILLCWPLLGVWALPAVYLLTLALQLYLMIRYVTDTYRMLGWLPLDFSFSPRSLKRLLQVPKRALASAAAAGLFLGIDGLLVLALFLENPSGNNELFFLFYLIGPLIRAAHDWSNLFYFDFKNLELHLFNHMRERFEAFLFQLAFLLGVICWLASLAVSLSFLPPADFAIYVLLLPFFISRSLLAFFQTRAFAETRFIDLVITGVIFVSAALGAATLGSEAEPKIASLTLIFLIMLVFLRVPRLPASLLAKEQSILPFSEWLQRTRIESVSLQAGAFRLASGISDHQVDRLARVWMRALGRGARVTRFGSRTVAWHLIGTEPAPSEAELLSIGGGMIEHCCFSGLVTGGDEALESLTKAVLPIGADDVSESGVGGGEEIEIINLGEDSSEIVDRYSSRELSDIFRAAAYFCERMALSPERLASDEGEKLVVGVIGAPGTVSEIHIKRGQSGDAKDFEKQIRRNNIELLWMDAVGSRSRSSGS